MPWSNKNTRRHQQTNLPMAQVGFLGSWNASEECPINDFKWKDEDSLLVNASLLWKTVLQIMYKKKIIIWMILSWPISTQELQSQVPKYSCTHTVMDWNSKQHLNHTCNFEGVVENSAVKTAVINRSVKTESSATKVIENCCGAKEKLVCCFGSE